MNKSQDHFESLAWKFLDQDMSEEEFSEFQLLLKDNQHFRKLYQHLVEVHQAIMLRADQGNTPISFSNTEIKPRLFNRTRWKWIAIVSVAACLLLLGSLMIIPKQRSLEVEYMALRNADIRGKNIREGDKATTSMIHLANGAVALRFPGNTEAVIEGPAWYQVKDNQSVILSSGTITVHHEGEPGQFKVITPLGDLTDMGTKFGVSVGDGFSESMVMTEVYEGEVIFSNSQSSRHNITEGQGVAIIGRHESQNILRKINGEQIKVSGRFKLSETKEQLKSLKNLALGKPVKTNSTYRSDSGGEVFEAEALTDGRFFDSGSPWNWSFWLAVNEDSGIATVDLLEVHTVSKVELQNTRNRHFDDRGMKDFAIELSLDGKSFKEVARGQLKRVSALKEGAFPMESFEFKAQKARYVRIRGLSHYSKPGKSHGGCGGLNEIRVFE